MMMTDGENTPFSSLAWITVLVILSACCHVGRPREDAPSAVAQTNRGQPRREVSELKQQIEAFASYGGHEGWAARKFLDAYPSEKLVPDIEALCTQAGEDEIFKMQGAFVLCFFGHDYDSNKKKITEALRASRNDRKFDSIGAQSMISELIRRGDSTLLLELFNAATWSDGALSEGLATTFGEQLANNPNDFLSALDAVSAKEKRGVFSLTDGSSLSPEQMIEVEKRLTSPSVPSSLRPIARELLANLRSNRKAVH